MESESRDRIISFIYSMNLVFLENFKNIEFNKGNPHHLYLICFYGRIIELSISILSLMKAKSDAGIPIVLRTMLEAFVDFSNLIQNKDYLKVIVLSYLNQRERFIKNYADSLDPSEMEEGKKTEIDTFIGGCKPQNIFERFNNIGLKNTYISAYHMLCSYSHNNLNMLEKRHIDKTENDFDITFFKEETFDMFIKLSMTMGALLVDTHNMLMGFFRTPLSKDAKEMCDEFKEKRIRYK